MRYWSLAPLALAATPLAAHAAECAPAFTSGDQSVTVSGIEISPGARSIENFQLSVRNAGAADEGAEGANGSDRCPATIRVSRLSAPLDPSFPSYTISAPGQPQLDILPDALAGGSAKSDVEIANAPANPQGRAVPFQVLVKTGWDLTAGTYTDRLEALLLDERGTIVDRSYLTVTIVVPATVSVRFVGAVIGGGFGGDARIDLGTLSSTQDTRSQPFGVRIFSTAPYLVSLDSANRGNLAHETLSSLVPYQLYFDGARVDLAGAVEYAYPSGTPRSGETRPMSLRVPAVVAPAGEYRDRLTVTVSAR